MRLPYQKLYLMVYCNSNNSLKHEDFIRGRKRVAQIFVKASPISNLNLRRNCSFKRFTVINVQHLEWKVPLFVAVKYTLNSICQN